MFLVGDRHLSNILIDTATAEVVHIDLGIAFDQGRNLRVPELVPFRLTRDMVDPMGVCGIEGRFKRSATATLRVLRESKDMIVTILSVLLEDPLSQWELTELKKEKAQPPTEKLKKSVAVSTADPSQQLQSGSSESKNQHAMRVLERLKEKLEGIELEKADRLTPERQTGFLIDEARNFQNLAQIYHGWGPFL